MSKNILLIYLFFYWSKDQHAGIYGHGYGRGEFMIGTFIKLHILRANHRWWIYDLRLPIGQQFQRCRIHSDILLLWLLLCENRRLWSNVMMPREYQLGSVSGRTTFTVTFFSGENSYAWSGYDSGTAWGCWLSSILHIDLEHAAKFLGLIGKEYWWISRSQG